jgi:hypothetical protein
MATGLGTPNIGTLAPLIATLPPWLFQRLVEQRQCLPERTVARIEQQILMAGVELRVCANNLCRVSRSVR